jgi:Abi-like protein
MHAHACLRKRKFLKRKFRKITQVKILPVIQKLSSERFEAYRQPDESDKQALARVCWNTALSEALYPCLQGLEVGFRNSLHQAVATLAGTGDWILKDSRLEPNEKKMHAEALQQLRTRNKPETAGYLVAELKFGFWTSLVDSRYHRLWPKIIKEVVPGMPNRIRTREEISKRLNEVRFLRNAVSHHHSIWHWPHLKKQHETIHELIGWIDPDYGAFVKSQDRFEEVLKDGVEVYLRRF